MSKPQKLLALRVGDERFALSVFAVRDMLRARPALPIPRAPAFVTGVLNLRGRLATVLDLRLRLGAPAQEPGIMIVVEHEQELLALIADAVVEVTSVKTEELHKPSKHQALTGSEAMRGGSTLHLLDLARLLEA